MYEQFFGFRRRPFPAAPSLRHYVALQTMEDHRAKLTRCLARSEGVGLIVGPTGTGKTLLCRAVGADLRARCDVVMPAVGRIPSRKALFQAVLFELRRPFQGMDEGELRLALMDDLLSREREKPLVLIIDEADTLSLRILDELRLLLNLGHGEEPPLQLLLSGGTLLEEKLAAAKLQPLSQRIAARCYLDALSRAETFTYVREQIRLCNGDADALLSEEALAAVYHATGGVPRLINQICDHALLLAYADEVNCITPEMVQEAWSDLQQLPMPWEPFGGQKSAPSQVVEFGTLDDGLSGSSNADSDDPARDFRTDDFRADSDGGRESLGESPSGEDWPAAEDAETACREAGPKRFHGAARSVNGPSGAFPISPAESLGDPATEQPTDPTEPAEPLAIRPLEHLHQAEQALRQLRQEFRPPAAKTEVELIFEDWGNPFEEEFQQVIPVTSGPTRETAAETLGGSPLSEPFHDRVTERETKRETKQKTEPETERETDGETAEAGSLEIVVESEDEAAGPTVRAAPLSGEESPDLEPGETGIEPGETGIAEVLIFDPHAGTAATEDAENGRRGEATAFRSPKFRRLFSRLQQRAAESQEA